MRRARIYALTGALIFMSVAGCGPTPAPSSDNPAKTVPPETPLSTRAPAAATAPSVGKDKTNMTGIPIPLPLDPANEAIATQAKQDLAQRLSVSTDQIDLVEVQSVSWPDGSLGCPQPGMMYTQMVVDGLLIRLRARGNIYEYHSGGSRAPFLCQ